MRISPASLRLRFGAFEALTSSTTDIGTLQSTTTAQGNTLSNHTNSLATHATDIGNLQTTSTSQGTTLTNHTNSLATHATDIGNLQTAGYQTSADVATHVSAQGFATETWVNSQASAFQSAVTNHLFKDATNVFLVHRSFGVQFKQILINWF